MLFPKDVSGYMAILVNSKLNQDGITKQSLNTNFNNIDKLCSQLFDSSLFNNSQDFKSRDQFKKSAENWNSNVENKNKLNFLLVLSDVLHCNESNISNLWEDQLQPDVNQVINYNINYQNELSLYEIELIRNIYFNQRINMWDLLQELLRVDMDIQHHMHPQVSSYIDSYLKSNLISMLLDYLIKIQSWQPNTIEPSLFNRFHRNDVHKFIQSHHRALADFYLLEIQNILDTLILLSYHRRSLNLNELILLITKFINDPLQHSTNYALQILLYQSINTEVLKINKKITEIYFKYIILFSECCQFWRLFQKNYTDLPIHSLFILGDSLESASIVYSLEELTILFVKHIEIQSFQLTSSNNSTKSDINQYLPTVLILVYVWYSFITAFMRYEQQQLISLTEKTIYKRLYNLIHTDNGYFDDIPKELFQLSVSCISNTTTTTTALTSMNIDANHFFYCSILQEFTNVLILLITLSENAALQCLASITALIEITYRRKDQLCCTFWEHWNSIEYNADSYEEYFQHLSHSQYPLCRLVNLLLYNAPHDPQYLFKILAALACTPENCQIIACQMLNQPVYYISSEHFTKLHFRKSNISTHHQHKDGYDYISSSSYPNNDSYDLLHWDNSTQWLREHRNKVPNGTHVMKVDDLYSQRSHSSGNVSIIKKGLWSSDDNTEGVPVEVIEDNLDSSYSAGWYTNTKGGSNKQHPMMIEIKTPRLCEVRDKTQGKVIGVDYENQVCLVKWNLRYNWWVIIMDLLLVQTNTNKILNQDTILDLKDVDQLIQVSSLLCLFNALLNCESLNEVIAYFITKRWDDILLINLLMDDIHCKDAFKTIFPTNIRIQHIKNDPSTSYEQLIELGIKSTNAEYIIKKVFQSSDMNIIKDDVYQYSFEDILCNVTVSMMKYFMIHLISNTYDLSIISNLFINTFELHCMIGKISQEWMLSLEKFTNMLVIDKRCMQQATKHHLYLQKSLIEDFHENGFIGYLYYIAIQDHQLLPEIFLKMNRNIIECDQMKSVWVCTNSNPIKLLFNSIDTLKSGKILTVKLISYLTNYGMNNLSIDVLKEYCDEVGIQFPRSYFTYSDLYQLITSINLKIPFTLPSATSSLSMPNINDLKNLQSISNNNKLIEFQKHMLHLGNELVNNNIKQNSLIESDQNIIIKVDFLFNQFILLFKSEKVIENPEKTLILLLSVTETIDMILEKNENNSFISKCCYARLISNPFLLEAFIQLSLLIGLLSLRISKKTENHSKSSFNFKSLFTTHSNILISQSSLPNKSTLSLLPLDFESQGCLLGTMISSSNDNINDHISSNSLENVLKLSLKSSNILNKLLKYQSKEKNNINQTITSIFTSNINNFLGLNWLINQAFDSNNNTFLVSNMQSQKSSLMGTYMTVLIGMIDDKLKCIAMKELLETLLVSYCDLLSTLIICIPENNKHQSNVSNTNFSDYVGLLNCKESIITFSRILEYDNTALVVKQNILKLILLLAEKQPNSLSLMLNTTSSSDTTSVIQENKNIHTHSYLDNSILLKAFNYLLLSTEELYYSNPLLLNTIYRIFIVFSQSKHHLTLQNAIIALMQRNKKFWDYITLPLMIDVPIAPDLTLQFKPFNVQNIIDVIHNMDEIIAPNDITSPSSSCRNDKDVLFMLDKAVLETPNVLDNTNIMQQCQQLQCHALALQLLSFERYGLYYEVNSEIALQISKKMHTFYLKATECHRFNSWINHYLQIGIDVTTMKRIYNEASYLGMNVSNDLLTHRHKDNAKYGLENVFSHQYIEMIIQSTYKSSVIRNTDSNVDQMDLYLLSKLKNYLLKYNLNANYSQVSLDIIESWRKFLEFYVLPALPIKQYFDKLDQSNIETTSQHTSVSINSSNDVQVGSLSPVTNITSASPITMKKSAFDGDKRSYEVVTEVLKRLENHSNNLSMNSFIGRQAIAQQCDLLVSMLHHQLKTVGSRTSDPGKSEVINREIGSMRLNQVKMEDLLMKLNACFSDLICKNIPSIHDDLLYSRENSLESNVYVNLKDSIILRLLTAMSLLLNSIYAFDSTYELRSDKSKIRRSIFLYAIVLLTNLYHQYGIQVFSNVLSVNNNDNDGNKRNYEQQLHAYEETKEYNLNKTTKEKMKNNTQTQSIVQVCLQLIKLTIPCSNGLVAMSSLTDINSWDSLFQSPLTLMSPYIMPSIFQQSTHNINAMEALIHILDRLSIATTTLPTIDNHYDELCVDSIISGKTIGNLCSIKFKNEFKEKSNMIAYQELSSLCSSFISILDLFINALGANIVLPFDHTIQLHTLLKVLINSSLLKQYQLILSNQPDHVVAVLMGYSCKNLEISIVATCWIKSMNFIQTLISKLNDTKDNSNNTSKLPSEDMIFLQNSIVVFFETYTNLLLVPLRINIAAQYRYSIQQLLLIQVTMSLFTSMNTNFTIWKTKNSSLWLEINTRSNAVLRIFSLLLWHGDDIESSEQQLRLLHHSVAISSFEKLEESTITRKKIRSHYEESPYSISVPIIQHNVHFGEDKVFNSKSSNTLTTSDSHEGSTSSIAIGGRGGAAIAGLGVGSQKSILKLHHPTMHRSHIRRSSSIDDTQKVDQSSGTLIKFLLDIESHMILAITPLVVYLRQICHVGPYLEVSRHNECGLPIFALGTHIFYIITSVEDMIPVLVEGVIIKIYPNEENFDVLLVGSNLIESNIHCTQVCYTSSPLIPFQSLSDISKREVDENMSIIFHHGHIQSSSIYVSTAHLLRTLQLVTSTIAMNRLQESRYILTIQNNIELIAGQITWLIVSTIAHHARAALGRESSMIHQLNDVKKAIRIKDNHTIPSITSGTTIGIVTSEPLDKKHWMKESDWIAYVTWIDRWCDEIFYQLGHGSLHEINIPQQQQPDESLSERKRKKRIGLRARIEWVQSPEEV